MTDTQNTDWVAVDWGTTHLRAWHLTASGTELASAKSDKGMGKLSPDQFEAALLDLIAPWLGDHMTTVIACGMVGARQGWVEAPYRTVPCTPFDAGLIQAPTRDPRLGVFVIPGLCQTTPSDVMRGEETQVAGFLSLNKDFDGILCLPGTHTKWVHVSAGEVVSFQTFMTGELFALLADHSVLRHSVLSDNSDDAAFADAVADAIATPQTLAARLFSIRADGLLNGLEPATARARLSGLLIGAELAAARPYWLGQQIAVIGSAALARAYVDALGQQGAPAILATGNAMTLAGLTAARATPKDPSQ